MQALSLVSADACGIYRDDGVVLFHVSHQAGLSPGTDPDPGRVRAGGDSGSQHRAQRGAGRGRSAVGGDSKDAVRMIIADKLEELMKTQVDAIKNIKIDKVTVWENGGGGKEGEGNSTSRFVSGLYKSIPPLTDMFNMAGMNLPDYLGEKITPPAKAPEITDAVVEESKD